MSQYHGLRARRRGEPSRKMEAKLFRAGNRKSPVRLSVYFPDGVLDEIGVLPQTPGRVFYSGENEFCFDFCNGVKGYDKFIGHPIIQPIDTKGRFSVTVEDVTHWYWQIERSVECDVEIVRITPGAGMRFKIIPRIPQK